MYLHKETYRAFKNMFYAAQKCGVDLRIISATRSFAYQRGIWERKWRSERFADKEGVERVRKIMLYSAMPGASRHHWGTDIDLNDLNNQYFDSGEGKEVYEWLQTHASEYGFYQTYTDKKNGRTGYEEEKWHWTYLPISSKLLQQYNEKIDYKDLRGFTGSEYARELKVIEDFVNGVELE
jgi:LAS superfamily LD-carboxypeptidase LdcB